MRQYRILASAMEVKTDSRKSSQQLSLKAEVEQDAIEGVMSIVRRKPETDEDEEAADPKKKVPKMSVEARRNKKIKSDLAQGDRLLEQLKGSDLRHTSELCANLKS